MSELKTRRVEHLCRQGGVDGEEVSERIALWCGPRLSGMTPEEIAQSIIAMAKQEMRTIRIYKDSVFATEGRINEKGAIVDAPAPLPEDVYDGIECAIKEEWGEVNLHGSQWTWEISND